MAKKKKKRSKVPTGLKKQLLLLALGLGLLGSGYLLTIPQKNPKIERSVLGKNDEHGNSQRGKEKEGQVSSRDLKVEKGAQKEIEETSGEVIEVRHEGFDIKYQERDGEVDTKIEQNGEPLELTEDRKKQIQKEAEIELKDEGFEISSEAGKPVLRKNKFTTKSHYPLSVDSATGELIITTPAGKKVVTVLPEKAVANMLARGVLDVSIDPEENEDGEGATESGILSQDEVEIELGVEEGEPVYEIKGKKKFNVFGILPTEGDVTAIVSAVNGELIREEKSFFTRFIDLISF